MPKTWDLLVGGIQFLAGFGLFFVGVRALSEGIQALFGTPIRHLINSVGDMRPWNWAVGVLLSVFLVSDAVTATMIIGFVNSGLLSFVQALSILSGSHLGGAILGWLMAFPHLELNPMYFVALGLVVQLLLRQESAQNLGRVIFAMGLMLWGYMVMTNNFTSLRGSVALEPWWMTWGDLGFFLRLFLLVSAVLVAFVLRSGGALWGVVFALVLSGLASLEVGLLLMIGIQMGQALIPLTAAFRYNRATQRVAAANLFLQVVAALIFIFFSGKFASWVAHLLPGLDAQSLDLNGLFIYAPLFLAIAYTLYYFMLSLPPLLLAEPFAEFAEWVFRSRKVKESQQLVFLGGRFTLAPSLAIEQAYQEIKKLAAMVQTMLTLAEGVVRAGRAVSGEQKRVIKYEKITDNIQREVLNFLELVMAANLTRAQAHRVRSLMRIVDELESIADQSRSIVGQIEALSVADDERLRDPLVELAALLAEILRFYEISFSVVTEADPTDADKNSQTILEFNARLERLKEQILERLRLQSGPPAAGLAISELLTICLSIRDHTINVLEAFHGGQKVNLDAVLPGGSPAMNSHEVI